jgi:hypothetical protein
MKPWIIVIAAVAALGLLESAASLAVTYPLLLTMPAAALAWAVKP